MMHTVATESIVAARGKKRPVTADRPYAWLAEREPGPGGVLKRIATVFLTNRECPFRCVMCDLWRNTTDVTVPRGAIPRQIDFALERLPQADWIKLYNSGNFFDAKAIPPADDSAIIDRIQSFERVVVENHPRLCGERCLAFARQLRPELEVAMGLETADPAVLQRLNKNMTRDDFRRAAGWLRDHGLGVRGFILVQPPFVSADQARDLALQSVQFAFDCGVQCCALVPTRGGNGIMEELAARGEFTPPTLRLLEEVFAAALTLAAADRRVLLDVWDADRWGNCTMCRQQRSARLAEMNLTQRVLPPITCHCDDTARVS